MKITKIDARQMLDTKGRPVVEVDVHTECGALGRGVAPTGSSVGAHESFVLRDGLKEYDGLSVHKAVDNVKKIIAPKLLGKDVFDLSSIDNFMNKLDPSDDKHDLGGNAIYSVSVACLRAAAQAKNQTVYEYLKKSKITEVPIPSFNVINGGSYKNFTQAFNEFIIIPYKAKDIFEAVEIGVTVFKKLAGVIKEYQGYDPRVANSYGYCAPSNDPRVILTLMERAVKATGYGDKVAFGIDCASSEVYDKATNTYLLKDKRISVNDLVQYLKKLTNDFPILFIEDPCDEDDWKGFQLAHKVLTNTLIIGDDFIVTNRKRLEKAVQLDCLDGFVLKPNQVGTISEALDTLKYAKEKGLTVLPSGRSGGIIGDVIMDLAVAFNVGFIKNGAPRSGERIDKLNYLMRIVDFNPDVQLANVEGIVRF